MPLRGNKLYCPSCNHEQPQVNLLRCKRCGCDLGAPNVNEVSTEVEINALRQRYQNAKGKVVAEGNLQVLEAFEKYFLGNVQALINIDFAPLKSWLLNDDAYKNYYRLTRDGIRDIAHPDNDRKRNKVDGFLFGTYGRDMIFAALSLNNSGLKSYGDCSVALDEDIIAQRSTVIEENSYNFAKKHDINFEVVQIPPGYRAIWRNKLELAVSKIYDKLRGAFEIDDFCDLILYSNGIREEEDFMEVHIYNELSEYAVKNVSIPDAVGRKNKFDLKRLNKKYPGKIFVV